jgi:hypothetical protein
MSRLHSARLRPTSWHPMSDNMIRSPSSNAIHVAETRQQTFALQRSQGRADRNYIDDLSSHSVSLLSAVPSAGHDSVIRFRDGQTGAETIALAAA